MKLINFFLLSWIFFALLDPDPVATLNPDPIRIRIRIRIRIHDTVAKYCVVLYCWIRLFAIFSDRVWTCYTHLRSSSSVSERSRGGIHSQDENDPVVEFTDRMWMIQWGNSQTVCEWSSGGIHRQYLNDLVVKLIDSMWMIQWGNSQTLFEWSRGGINRQYVNDPVVEFTDSMWMIQWWNSETACAAVRFELWAGLASIVTVNKLSTIQWNKAG